MVFAMTGHPCISRRTLLRGGVAVSTAATVSAAFPPLLGGRVARAAGVSAAFSAQPLPHSFRPGRTETLWSYRADGAAAPGTAPQPMILRARQGQPFTAVFTNHLPEPTTVHWHGLRLPVAMDGVPFLTQNPVNPGDSFTYTFTPPDAGTFWLHPHLNSLTQLSRGLSALLIVEEAQDPGFDADIPLLLRDWRIGSDGAWLDLVDERESGRAGTFGPLHTASGQEAPVLTAPAGGLVRLRLCNADVTRILRIVADDLPKGAAVQVIAIDGHPLAKPETLDRESIGPGMRCDLLVRMPERAGDRVSFSNTSSSSPWTVVTLTAEGPSRKRRLPQRNPLPANPVSRPDLKTAESLRFDFGAGVEDGEKSSTAKPALWSINRRAWVEAYGVTGPTPELPMLPGQSFAEAKAAICGDGTPLATLERNRTYLLELTNYTPHPHPIHLHGLAVQMVSSTRDGLRIGQIGDTVLLGPKERAVVAVVADNPGDWMMHCHIIEHQASGMMGVVRVT
ncbi:multicopper oxidase family protein [Novispirillum itersonii subsp. nipponicum]